MNYETAESRYTTMPSAIQVPTVGVSGCTSCGMLGDVMSDNTKQVLAIGAGITTWWLLKRISIGAILAGAGVWYMLRPKTTTLPPQ